MIVTVEPPLAAISRSNHFLYELISLSLVNCSLQCCFSSFRFCPVPWLKSLVVFMLPWYIKPWVWKKAYFLFYCDCVALWIWHFVLKLYNNPWTIQVIIKYLILASFLSRITVTYFRERTGQQQNVQIQSELKLSYRFYKVLQHLLITANTYVHTPCLVQTTECAVFDILLLIVTDSCRSFRKKKKYAHFSHVDRCSDDWQVKLLSVEQIHSCGVHWSCCGASLMQICLVKIYWVFS